MAAFLFASEYPKPSQVPDVLLRPNDGSILVRLRIPKTLAGARCAAHDAPQRWALLRIASLLDCVALCTLRLEELRPFLCVACWHFNIWLRDRHDGSKTRT